jgi:arabinogalactan oligomer/maltooligosaccharide transport system substrate-binding protein
MQVRRLSGVVLSFGLVFVLATLLAWAVTAQGPGPSEGSPQVEAPTELPAAETDAVTRTVFLSSVGRNSVTTPYSLTLWHQWSDAYEQEYQDVLDEFSAAHPEFEIELMYVGDMANALAVAIPLGVGPDLVAWANDRIGHNALAGYLIPLDPWITEAYLADTFEPAAAQAMIWNGQVWGVPESQEGIALVYNRDLISETLLPDPDDFGDLLAKAADFQLTHPGKYYVCNQGLGNPDAYHVAPVYFGLGLQAYGGYLDEEGQVCMTTTAAISAAQWISSFRPYAPAETSHGDCQDMMVNGEVGSWWTGPWAIADIEDAGIDYGLAPMGSPFVGVRLFMMTQNALDRDNAAAVIQLINHLTSAAVQKRLALAVHLVPANTAALHDPEVQALETIAGFGESLNRGTPMGNHPYTGCQWDPVGNATTAIWMGLLTPEEAMQAAQAAIVACVEGMGGR